MKADASSTKPYVSVRANGREVTGRTVETVSCTCGKLQCILEPVPMGTGIDLKFMKGYTCLGIFCLELAAEIKAVKGGHKDESNMKTALFGMDNSVHIMNGIRHKRMLEGGKLNLTDTGD